MTQARSITLLAAALVLVAGLAYLASQTVLAPPQRGVTFQQGYVAAPRPAQADVVAPAGQPLGAPVVDPAWVQATAVKAGIPEPALRAYAAAQLQVADRCALGWTTLAGVGWAESQHGTIGDRVIDSDGYSSRPILGPALDGKGAFAAIPSTPESRQWHGNPRWDHAVGPLQFITSTWLTWGADGDGDGEADPNDIDDAAYTAARYLCADGHDLTTGEGWSAAIFSYNHSEEYVADVHAAASTYAERTS